MRTRPLILAVAALALVSLPLLAAEPPDITGTWAIGAPKSDFGAMPARTTSSSRSRPRGTSSRSHCSGPDATSVTAQTQPRAALLPKLGLADRQRLPGRSPRLCSLWPAHEHPRLRERSALHQPNPRTPGPWRAAAGQAPTCPRDPPCRRARYQTRGRQHRGGSAGVQATVDQPSPRSGIQVDRDAERGEAELETSNVGRAVAGPPIPVRFSLAAEGGLATR
jgi:hypothetical protein